MKKRITALIMCGIMAVGMISGCGKEEEPAPVTSDVVENETAPSVSEADSSVSAETAVSEDVTSEEFPDAKALLEGAFTDVDSVKRVITVDMAMSTVSGENNSVSGDAAEMAVSGDDAEMSGFSLTGEMSMGVSGTITTEITKETEYTYGNMSVDFLGFKEDSEIKEYIDHTSGIKYEYDTMAESWTSTETDIDFIGSLASVDNLDYEKATIEEKDDFYVAGYPIKGGNDTESDDSFSAAMPSIYDALDEPMIMYAYFNKDDNKLVKIEMSALPGEYPDAFGNITKIDAYEITIDYSDYNDLPAVTIPEDVISASVSANE